MVTITFHNVAQAAKNDPIYKHCDNLSCDYQKLVSLRTFGTPLVSMFQFTNLTCQYYQMANMGLSTFFRKKRHQIWGQLVNTLCVKTFLMAYIYYADTTGTWPQTHVQTYINRVFYQGSIQKLYLRILFSVSNQQSAAVHSFFLI